MSLPAIGTHGYRQIDDIFYSCTVTHLDADHFLVDLLYCDDGKAEVQVPVAEFLFKDSQKQQQDQSSGVSFSPLTEVFTFFDTIERFQFLSVSKEWNILLLKPHAGLMLANRTNITELQMRQMLHYTIKQHPHTMPVPFKYLITTIQVLNCSISDDLALYLIRMCPKLESLICNYCPSLTDDFMKELMPPSRLGRNLKRLDFWQSNGLSFTQSKQLQTLRPTCVVQSSGIIPLELRDATVAEMGIQTGLNVISKRRIIQDVLQKKTKSDFYCHVQHLTAFSQVILIRTNDDEATGRCYVYDSIESMQRQYDQDPVRYSELRCAIAPKVAEVFALEDQHPVLIQLDAQRAALAAQLQCFIRC